MSDLNPDGAAGNASAATAEKGEMLLDHAVRGLVELVEDVDRFDLADLRRLEGDGNRDKPPER